MHGYWTRPGYARLLCGQAAMELNVHFLTYSIWPVPADSVIANIKMNLDVLLLKQ
jgi:hypothetical protein